MARNRVPGIRSGWQLAENPAYADKPPQPLDALCHDGTAFLSVRCGCGYELHLHESSLFGQPADAEVVTNCLGCRRLLSFPPGFLQDAFAHMRAEGWIA